MYKTKIVGSTPADDNTIDAEVIVPLKYLSNVQRSLDLLLINCEIELDFLFSQDCVNLEYQELLKYLLIQLVVTGTAFQINSTKLYVPVVTLSINYTIKFLENLKQGFKRTIS